jgi:O-antigen biosynthesis protein
MELRVKVSKVAIIYDDCVRPDTTGIYCRRALGEMVEVEHFLPSELSRIPREGFDLYINIDDGLRYRLPRNLRPSIWWAIDTHLDNDGWYASKGEDFDLVFCAQQQGVESLQRSGIPAIWLPLACDPTIHRPFDVHKEWDFCFVGNLFDGPRSELVRLLQQTYPSHFVGNAYFTDMARVYSASRVVFNRSLRGDLNMRIFEALACQTLLLTDELPDNGLPELFQDGVHLATYRSSSELLQKIAFYLNHPSDCARVAKTGYQLAIQQHSYLKRMQRILEYAESLPVVNMSESSPLTRDRGYLEHVRQEVLSLVPIEARQILDVGCGTGRFGEAIKIRQNAEITGLEAISAVAKEARTRLDFVVEGNVELIADPFAPQSFDTIICADVLEHLREPLLFLQKVHRWLESNGTLVVSVHNVQHHSVVAGLIAGNWTYEPAGLLDRDHVRFFTRREIEKLLFRAGFEVRNIDFTHGPEYRSWIASGKKSEIDLSGLRLGGLTESQCEEFFAYQYLLTAIPRKPIPYQVTSIIIPTHNQIAYTRICIESIRTFTDEPYELIVVDNGSDDGTAEYLSTATDIQLIRNSVNLGFPKAVNQGIVASRGTHILLLNNDTLVTTGWLTRMLRTMESDPLIGLVGPCSNCVSGSQQVPADYNLEGLDGFAWERGKTYNRQVIDSDRLIGFCLLIRRQVIEEIGLFDERFGLGCFEDDDFTRRAVRAGFRAVIAWDSFVHHFGGRTFIADGVDYSSLLNENQKRFDEKWDSEAPTRSLQLQHNSGIDGLILERQTTGKLSIIRHEPILTLCMIVRNNESTIGPCLESIRPWVDEMIVVDTGSIDQTPSIATALGAKVFHYPWPDSFSEARNESIRHASGDWIFWMDSDDVIDRNCGQKLRSLLNPISSSTLGYVMQVRCPGPGEFGHMDLTIVDHVKLFRNRPELRFEGRIHEQILPAIRRVGGEIEWTDLFVTHSGYDHTPNGQKRKIERDLKLLHLELSEQSEHPFTLFNLGMTYSNIGEHTKAIEFLRRSIAVSVTADSHVRKAYSLLVYSLSHAGQVTEAKSTCDIGLSYFADDVELRFRSGILHHDLGQYERAVKIYTNLLNDKPKRYFASSDPGMTGFKARHNLAIAYTDMGNLKEAEIQWRAIIQEVPTYPAGWRGLGDCLLVTRRLNDAQLLLNQLGTMDGLAVEAYLLKSRISYLQGNLKEAIAILSAAHQQDATDIHILRSLCQWLFEAREYQQAGKLLEILGVLAPSDGAVFHNQGLASMQLGNFDIAVKQFQKSLQIRPNSPMTLRHLAYSFESLNRMHEAKSTWESILESIPGDSEAIAKLAQSVNNRLK